MFKTCSPPPFLTPHFTSVLGLDCQVREAEIGIDATIGPVEESFALLNKHELLFNDGNAERVDGLTYAWKNLNALVRRCGRERAPDLNAKR